MQRAGLFDQVVGTRADYATEQRRERDLVGPVDRTPELAQPARDERSTGQEAEREAHAERLDRDAQEFDFGLHGSATGGIGIGAL